MVSDALSVVSGRHGDDTSFLLIRREGKHFVESTSIFERACSLEVFVFTEDACSCEVRKSG